MEDVLLMFSGGKDSFISACRLVTEGYRVRLLSFNNGAVLGEENLLHGVKRLQNRFGEDHVIYEGVYNTSAVVSRISDTWSYTPHSQLGGNYPTLINAQVQCLHCQSAMWISAIAYAVAKNIKTIATGYRKSDLFCTGCDEYIESISNTAEAFGISLKFPVWDTPEWDELDGWERDNEMLMYDFEPQVYEPKCVLGKPVKAMSKIEKRDFLHFFDRVIHPCLCKEITHMIEIFIFMTLSPVSMKPIHFDVPDPTKGLY